MTNSVPTVAALAEQAATTVHELTLLTRPGITSLDLEQVYATTRALTHLTAAMPQTLRQLETHLHAARGLTVPEGPPCQDPATAADPARACLRQAGVVAAHLAAVLDTAHQALGDLAENTENHARGSVFNRR